MKIVNMKPIVKGWSSDRKFRVTDDHGTKYLLRISAPEKYDAKRWGFEMMKLVASLGVPMCEPVAFGRLGELDFSELNCSELDCSELDYSEPGSGRFCGIGADWVYSVQTWIEGTDLEEIIRTMDAETQYEYGLQAGEILRRIHQIPAPEDMESWETFYNRKTDRKIEMARSCSLRFRGQEEMITYIEENRHLLADRPRVYQHGDFHTGNLMVDRQGRLHVIDFDRDDFGDPWEEFNRIVFSKEVSVDFTMGQILGYFGGEAVPEEFWPLLAFYMASNQIASPAWGLTFGEEEGRHLIELAEDVCDWFDGMKCPVPSWLRRCR